MNSILSAKSSKLSSAFWNWISPFYLIVFRYFFLVFRWTMGPQWARILAAWAIGYAIILINPNDSFDLRFQFRGPQKINPSIQVMELNQPISGAELKYLLKNSALERVYIVLTEKSWSTKMGYSATGMKFPEANKLVLWNPFLAPESHDPFPYTFHRDSDGIVRRIQLVGKFKTINFKGPGGTFPSTNLSTLSHGTPEIKNGILIIAPNTAQLELLTPVGPMSAGELTANILNNHIDDQWIQTLPNSRYGLLLFLVLMIAALIMRLPPSLSFLVTFWFGALYFALSLWLFDAFFFWLPMLSTLVGLTVGVVLLTGYHADRIDRRNWLLEKQHDSFHELEQLKNNFISLISHDLKTPISKIQAIADRRILTTNPLDSDSLYTDFRSIKESSNELNRYIQSILSLVRAESDNFSLRLEHRDINEVALDVVQQVTPLAREKRINITQDLEPIFNFEFDANLIREVMLNLVENGVKYSPAGSEIHLQTRELENEVRIGVEDQGDGIAPQDLPQIWNKFYRGKKDIHRTKGSGLGLFLVRFFVNMHGGRTEVESQEGLGTKFSIYLPIRQNIKESLEPKGVEV